MLFFVSWQPKEKIQLTEILFNFVFVVVVCLFGYFEFKFLLLFMWIEVYF